MSVVCLHIGQCGVQLGEEIWLKLLKTAQNDANNRHVMLQRDGQPRALFIDSEKKVIHRFARRMKASKVKLCSKKYNTYYEN